MVGQDAEPGVGPLVLPVGVPGQGLGRLDHRSEQVGGEDRVDPLEHGQDPLEAGPGVDARPGQGLDGPVDRAVVLHEDQVPDLDEPLLARRRPAHRPPRSRGPCRRRSPSWARTDRSPPSSRSCPPPGAGCGRRARRPRPPDLLGLVVALVDGDPQPVAVDAQHLGHQLPGEGDGIGLEVVAEAEVAQHLEERAVPLGGADDVDVDGPEALLHRGGPAPGRHLVAQEERLEGHHAGDGEQHRRVVGDEAGRGHRVWPRSTKNRVNAARRWSASIAVPGVTTSDPSCPGKNADFASGRRNRAIRVRRVDRTERRPRRPPASRRRSDGAGRLGLDSLGGQLGPQLLLAAQHLVAAGPRPRPAPGRRRSPPPAGPTAPPRRRWRRAAAGPSACCQVCRTLRSAHRVDPAPTATPVINQKVRLGISGARPFPLPDGPLRRVPGSGRPGRAASRRMPVAAPARTASTLTTGLANAR